MHHYKLKALIFPINESIAHLISIIVDTCAVMYYGV